MICYVFYRTGLFSLAHDGLLEPHWVLLGDWKLAARALLVFELKAVWILCHLRRWTSVAFTTRYERRSHRLASVFCCASRVLLAEGRAWSHAGCTHGLRDCLRATPARDGAVLVGDFVGLPHSTAALERVLFAVRWGGRPVGCLGRTKRRVTSLATPTLLYNDLPLALHLRQWSAHTTKWLGLFPRVLLSGACSRAAKHAGGARAPSLLREYLVLVLIRVSCILVASTAITLLLVTRRDCLSDDSLLMVVRLDLSGIFHEFIAVEVRRFHWRRINQVMNGWHSLTSGRCYNRQRWLLLSRLQGLFILLRWLRVLLLILLGLWLGLWRLLIDATEIWV